MNITRRDIIAMKLIRSIGLPVAGSIHGVACAHTVSGTAQAGTPQYKVTTLETIFNHADVSPATLTARMVW
jgi:hypothetical protein